MLNLRLVLNYSVHSFINLLMYFFISDLRPEQKERILDYVEKFCMTLLHQVLFCPLFTRDEEMDLAIQKRYWSIVHKIGSLIAWKNLKNFYYFIKLLFSCSVMIRKLLHIFRLKAKWFDVRYSNWIIQPVINLMLFWVLGLGLQFKLNV